MSDYVCCRVTSQSHVNLFHHAYQQEFLRQVATVVDTAIHVDELLGGGLILDTGIMQGRVEHDDGERQHVASIRVRENVCVQHTVSLRETFHHSVDLLGFSGQTKAPQKLPATQKFMINLITHPDITDTN